MTNAQITTKFFNATTAQTKSLILQNIAKHYGISEDEAFNEVTDEDAENLLDYVTGPERAATSVLMQKHGCR